MWLFEEEVLRRIQWNHKYLSHTLILSWGIVPLVVCICLPLVAWSTRTSYNYKSWEWYTYQSPANKHAHSHVHAHAHAHAQTQTQTQTHTHTHTAANAHPLVGSDRMLLHLFLWPFSLNRWGTESSVPLMMLVSMSSQIILICITFHNSHCFKAALQNIMMLFDNILIT